MTISIRRGSQDDIPTALALVESNLGDVVHPPDELLAPDIYRMKADDLLLLADVEGVPVGMLYGSAGHASGPAGHLTVLAVDVDHRGQGVGQDLIRAFALIGEEAGTDVVWVDVPDGLPEPEQHRLLSYYSRCGWTDRTGYLQGLTDHRREQMYGTVRTVLAAVGR